MITLGLLSLVHGSMLVLYSLVSVTALLSPLTTPSPLTSAKPQRVLPVFDPLGLGVHNEAPTAQQPVTAAAAVALAALLAAQPEVALAKGGEFGIWEGRIVSLAHPAVMASVYAASAWSAFTGLQWRRLRELGNEISDLKAEQKGFALTPEQVEAGAAPSLQYQSLATQIDALTATRKELAGGNFRDKHYQVGSVVLGLGTAFAIEGPVNTFLRAQKLFPGPHLYAGAGIVVCWAMAASLVPLMAKGKDAARYGHIGFNVLALGLFTWQLPTGWEILLKVRRLVTITRDPGVQRRRPSPSPLALSPLSLSPLSLTPLSRHAALSPLVGCSPCHLSLPREG